MEDAYCHGTVTLRVQAPAASGQPQPQQQQQVMVGGCFDGHGGDSVAKYIARNIPDRICSRLSGAAVSRGSVAAALSAAFTDLDQELHDKKAASLKGSTALVALVTRSTIHISSCGELKPTKAFNQQAGWWCCGLVGSWLSACVGPMGKFMHLKSQSTLCAYVRDSLVACSMHMSAMRLRHASISNTIRLVRHFNFSWQGPACHTGHLHFLLHMLHLLTILIFTAMHVYAFMLQVTAEQ
jgi:hypothetical protein